jgi:hypothetical protein
MPGRDMPNYQRKHGDPGMPCIMYVRRYWISVVDIQHIAVVVVVTAAAVVVEDFSELQHFGSFSSSLSHPARIAFAFFSIHFYWTLFLQ